MNTGVDKMTREELLACVVGGRGEQAIKSSRELLERFGHRLINVGVAEMSETYGVGEKGAMRLVAAVELVRRIKEDVDKNRVRITSPETVASIMMEILFGKEQEHLYVLLLNTKNVIIGQPHMLYKGTINSQNVRIAEVFKLAVRENAAAIIVCHNHPSGDPAPSPEDVAVTRAIKDAGELMDVELLDHIIVGDFGWVSLKAKGLLG